MKSDIPICVVGAGPCGAVTAMLLSKRGFSRVILLEKQKWPRSKTCAGGLGPRALSWLTRHELLPHITRASRTITSLWFTAPSGKSARLVSPGQMALVLPREQFDALLVERAVRAGADFRPSTRVTAVANVKNGVEVSTSHGGIEAAAVVVAGGAVPCIAGASPPAKYRADSIMARFADFPHNPFEMEMIFPAFLAPHYAWLFPESDGCVNVGLIAGNRPGRPPLHALFDEVLDRFFASRTSMARQMGPRRGAPLRCSGPAGRVIDGRVLLGGESAGLVNIATGEGIPYALESGELAAAAIARSLTGTTLNRESLFGYQRAVRWRFAWPMRVAAAFKGFVGSPVFPAAADLGTSRVFQGISAFLFAKV